MENADNKQGHLAPRCTEGLQGTTVENTVCMVEFHTTVTIECRHNEYLAPPSATSIVDGHPRGSWMHYEQHRLDMRGAFQDQLFCSDPLKLPRGIHGRKLLTLKTSDVESTLTEMSTLAKHPFPN